MDLRVQCYRSKQMDSSIIETLNARIEKLESEVKKLIIVSKIENSKDEKTLSKFKKADLEIFIKHHEIKKSSEKKVMVKEIWSFLNDSESDSDSDSDSD